MDGHATDDGVGGVEAPPGTRPRGVDSQPQRWPGLLDRAQRCGHRGPHRGRTSLPCSGGAARHRARHRPRGERSRCDDRRGVRSSLGLDPAPTSSTETAATTSGTELWRRSLDVQPGGRRRRYIDFVRSPPVDRRGTTPTTNKDRPMPPTTTSTNAPSNRPHLAQPLDDLLASSSPTDASGVSLAVTTWTTLLYAGGPQARPPTRAPPRCGRSPTGPSLVRPPAPRLRHCPSSPHPPPPRRRPTPPADDCLPTWTGSGWPLRLPVLVLRMSGSRPVVGSSSSSSSARLAKAAISSTFCRLPWL